jgi:hypothetical protein
VEAVTERTALCELVWAMGMVATSAHSSQLLQTDPTRAGGAVTCGGMLSIYPQACASCVRPLTVCMGGAHCGDAPEPLPTGGRGRGSARIPHPSDGTSAEAWLKPYEPTRVVCTHRRVSRCRLTRSSYRRTNAKLPMAFSHAWADLAPWQSHRCCLITSSCVRPPRGANRHAP